MDAFEARSSTDTDLGSARSPLCVRNFIVATLKFRRTWVRQESCPQPAICARLTLSLSVGLLHTALLLLVVNYSLDDRTAPPLVPYRLWVTALSSTSTSRTAFSFTGRQRRTCHFTGVRFNCRRVLDICTALASQASSESGYAIHSSSIEHLVDRLPL